MSLQSDDPMRSVTVELPSICPSWSATHWSHAVVILGTEFDCLFAFSYCKAAIGHVGFFMFLVCLSPLTSFGIFGIDWLLQYCMTYDVKIDYTFDLCMFLGKEETETETPLNLTMWLPATGNPRRCC